MDMGELDAQEFGNADIMIHLEDSSKIEPQTILLQINDQTKS